MNLYRVHYESNDNQMTSLTWYLDVAAEDTERAIENFKSAARTSAGTVAARATRVELIQENYQGLNMYSYQYSAMQQQAPAQSSWQNGNTYQTYVFNSNSGTYTVR